MSYQFTKQYAPPCFITKDGKLDESIDKKLIAWHHEEVEKSQIFLRSQRGFRSADACMSILYGDENPKPMGKLSVLSIKKLRRQAREAIANASNIRPRWIT